jgi:DNA-binding CsgD family transcriptional regulator
MLPQGATDRDLVEALNCSIYTVRAEIDKIMEKLGASNRAHIAFFVGVQQGVEVS